MSINEGEWDTIQQALIEQIEGNGNFFQGARFALNVGNRQLHAANLGTLRDRLSDINVFLWSRPFQLPR